MGDKEHHQHDPVWDAAWGWVTRLHEEKPGREDTAQALAAWLQEAPSHRDAYDKASRLWFLSGFAPTAHGVDAPDSPDRD
jgi:ferric-dicitrate binding protein FerR (iron transport regulator)